MEKKVVKNKAKNAAELSNKKVEPPISTSGSVTSNDTGLLLGQTYTIKLVDGGIYAVTGSGSSSVQIRIDGVYG